MVALFSAHEFKYSKYEELSGRRNTTMEAKLFFLT